MNVFPRDDCVTSSFFTGISAFANPKVVVIGAGLAGLTTAYRLQKAGMDVDLYEARERVGGRVLTVRLDGHIAELGGQSIADGGEAINIRSLIDEFGLELTESRVYLEHAYFDGKNLTPIKELTRSREFDPETLRNQLNQLVSISTNMKELLDEFIGEEDPLYKVIAVRLAAYEGASLEKLSPFYAETLFHMLLGGISFAHQWSKEEEGYVNLVSIKGGNALLPEKIASTLDTRLHLGMPLKGIAKAADGSFALTFQNEQEIRADILVLAIPCPVYEEIVFADHVIPPDRLKAIKSIKYGANAKILVPFSRIPSQKSGLINDQIISFFDAAESILTIYYTDATSLFSEETILNSYLQARPMLELGYGNDCPVFTTPIFAKDQNFKAYNTPIGYSWPNDPYARGSYSYIASGQEALLTLVEEKGEKFKVLFKPVEQTLFFVGEHASILLGVPGTMEAACESGERIARAILEMKEN